MRISSEKYRNLEKVSNDKGIIAALAIDQRGSMRRMIPSLEGEERDAKIKRFKAAVAKELTKYSSSILLDPIYGLDAIPEIDENAGLLLSYEITGFRDEFRQPALIEGWTAEKIKEVGANAVKILLYFDVDDTDENNDKKKEFVKTVGEECEKAGVPYFLEIIAYDNNIEDPKSKEFAKVKPRKVNEAVREFVKPEYKVDVLKLEVPVNMAFVEGFGDCAVYTRDEALAFFKEQSDISTLPFIFLSAGVSAQMFQDTLEFAKEAGSKFNGVLCGRATWKGGVDPFVEDEAKGKEWLETVGKENINDLNKVIETTAVSWKDKIEEDK